MIIFKKYQKLPRREWKPRHPPPCRDECFRVSMTPSQVPWNMEDRRCQLMPILFGRYYHFSELLIPLHILTLFPLRDCKLPNHFSFSLNTALMDTCKHTTLPISLMVSLGQISSQWEPQGGGWDRETSWTRNLKNGVLVLPTLCDFGQITYI